MILLVSLTELIHHIKNNDGNKLGDFLLKKEKLYLREYLKYVNPNMYNQLKKIGYEIIDDNSDQRCKFLYKCYYWFLIILFKDKYQPRSLSPGDYDFNQCDDDLYFSRNEFHQNITKLSKN